MEDGEEEGKEEEEEEFERGGEGGDYAQTLPESIYLSILKSPHKLKMFVSC